MAEQSGVVGKVLKEAAEAYVNGHEEGYGLARNQFLADVIVSIN